MDCAWHDVKEGQEMTELERMGAAAKKAELILALLDTDTKNRALLAIADKLSENADAILSANAEDIKAAREDRRTEAFIDRLTLTPARISGISQGIREIVDLPDPIGELISEDIRPNGLRIVKKRVPLGVAGMIFESRPNVIYDMAALCLKSGNCCILRGGKEAIRSNIVGEKLMREALRESGLPEDCIQLVKNTDRSSAAELMNLTAYLDVLIPRGGAGLIRSVAQNSHVPVIVTGEGICHVYIDAAADLPAGAKILENAKCSRPSVCNAAECVLIHESVLKPFLREALPLLSEKQVELRADERAYAALMEITGGADTARYPGKIVRACDEDWDTEFLDYILAVKTVDSLPEAMDFIREHGTLHSECIVTQNTEAADIFLSGIDAAAVYVNASTRFTDGGEFGLGAEIGISTQKLHVRGPMGLQAMTSMKYQIYGNGQIR